MYIKVESKFKKKKKIGKRKDFTLIINISKMSLIFHIPRVVSSSNYEWKIIITTTEFQPRNANAE